MSKELSASAQRVQQALALKGVDLKVVELPSSTRTALEAAQAVGCDVAQIAKSLVFRGGKSGQAVLVIAGGANRVDLKKMKAVLGEALEKADADFVRQATGFAIGGIPPIGHATALRTFVDEDLLTQDRIWAAAGTPHALFALTPNDLLRITEARVVDLKSN